MWYANIRDCYWVCWCSSQTHRRHIFVVFLDPLPYVTFWNCVPSERLENTVYNHICSWFDCIGCLVVCKWSGKWMKIDMLWSVNYLSIRPSIHLSIHPIFKHIFQQIWFIGLFQSPHVTSYWKEKWRKLTKYCARLLKLIKRSSPQNRYRTQQQKGNKTWEILEICFEQKKWSIEH